MNEEAENNIENHCHHCEDNPCLWSQYRDEILESVQTWILTLDDYPNNRFIRNRCYKTFTAMYHGVLGNGVRVDIPQCVKDGIRQEFPESSGGYVGFRP